MLVNLKSLIEDAEKNHYAVAGFTTPTLDTCEAVLQAAEEMMRMMDHSKIDIKGDRIEVDAAGKIRIKAERISLSGALGIRGTAG